jgi:hypothetical protein
VLLLVAPPPPARWGRGAGSPCLLAALALADVASARRLPPRSEGGAAPRACWRVRREGGGAREEALELEALGAGARVGGLPGDAPDEDAGAAEAAARLERLLASAERWLAGLEAGEEPTGPRRGGGAAAARARG